MPVLPYAVTLLALTGHTVWVLAVVNRIHAYGWNRKLVDVLTALLGLVLIGMPAWATWAAYDARGLAALAGNAPLASYGYAMCVVAAAAGLHSAYLTLHPERSGVVLSREATTINFAKELGADLAKPVPRAFCRLPGNQTLRLTVEQIHLAIPHLPPALVGLKIAHLTDLHLSGRYGKQMYTEIARLTNDWRPDLVALTGDLVEKPACFDWIDDVYGVLQAPGGVYFVLGNHDKKCRPVEMRRRLADTGAIDLGGVCQRITHQGTAIELVGNELPWFSPAGEFSGEPSFRVVLAHGPDQFGWAAHRDANLMLAGHNHGGQVRLPVIGALLTPSHTGTRYTCGTFRRGRTVMHVSRGTGSLAPLRWGCPPELSLLVLQRAKAPHTP